VSRSIGIIRQLISQNNKLFFAGTFSQRAIIQSYFPEVICIELNGYDFKFKGSGKWNLEILRNVFQLFRSIKTEKKTLNKICKELKIQGIISDHRYGFYHKSIPSYFITHQLTLPISRIQKTGQWWHFNRLKKFTSIWVLDNSRNTYAGALSKTTSNQLKIKSIGIQSRFTTINNSNKGAEPFILAVISGPFPYSFQLLEEIIAYSRTTRNTIKCILPTDLNKPTITPKNITFYPSNNWKELDEMYYNCTGVISRSGYSTLMDIEILQKKACLIPTPGQPEQMYLAKLHTNKYASNLSTLASDYFISKESEN
jgi:hypothetical protein